MRAEESDEKGAGSLRIAEIYASRQGEGLWTGQPSVFLRLSGCNLRCWFCDTRFASWEPEGDFLSVDQVIQRVSQFSEEHVVVTGGEPLIFADLFQLTSRLRAMRRVVTIETAGTVDQPFECDLLSISPKLLSSAPSETQHASWHRTHNARRERIDLVRDWIRRFPYQLKFVVASEADTLEVLGYLHRLGDVPPDRVWIMPEGTSLETLQSREKWVAPFCTQHGFRYCPRSHIQWYGNRRGT